MAGLATLGTIVGIAGTVVGAGAAIYSAKETYDQGVAQQQEYDRQASVDTLVGKNEYAAAQRESEQRQLEGKLIASRAMAYAAASGGGTGGDDPTIAKILTDNGDRAAYSQASVMYNGQAMQDNYDAQASAKRISGQNSYFGAVMRSFGTLAGGIGHLAESTAQYIPTSRPSPIMAGVGATGRVF